LGHYRVGSSLLHRVDPRIKLVGTLVLVIGVFSTHRWPQILFLTGIAAAMIWLGGSSPPRALKSLRPLRWLLLFTLVVHALLSPGHTLFGMAWLSRDGLVMGLLACFRLVLALVFSTLLTVTTSPAEVAGATASLLNPLSRFGLSIHGFAVQIMLVMHFIPVLRDEAVKAFGKNASDDTVSEKQTLGERGRRLAQTAAALILLLVERAEALTERVVQGETAVIEPAALPVPSRWGPLNWTALTVVLPVLVLVLGFLS